MDNINQELEILRNNRKKLQITNIMAEMKTIF
jgi:hypothetical protein